RTEFHGEAEEGQHGIAGDAVELAVLVLDRNGGELTVAALKIDDLADAQIHGACGNEAAHLVDAVRRAAEIVAAVDEGDAFGDGLKVERPVERTVTAADDD